MKAEVNLRSNMEAFHVVLCKGGLCFFHCFNLWLKTKYQILNLFFVMSLFKKKTRKSDLWHLLLVTGWSKDTLILEPLYIWFHPEKSKLTIRSEIKPSLLKVIMRMKKYNNSHFVKKLLHLVNDHIFKKTAQKTK